MGIQWDITVDTNSQRRFDENEALFVPNYYSQDTIN